jgi:hypothetical protein
VGVVDPIERFHVGALPHGGAHEVTHRVERADGRLLVRGDEERARQVGGVVLHAVERRELRLCDLKGIGEVRLHVRHLARAHCPLPHQLQRGTIRQDELDLLAEVGRRIAADGDVVEVRRVNAAEVETALDRVRGKPRHVFDAAEAFFFEGCDEVAVT